MKTGQQEDGTAARVMALVSTSVDDLKSTLPHESNAAVLNEARRQAFEGGMKSKVVLLDRRIQQLKRGAR